MSARQTQDSVAKDGSPILGLPRSRKGAWRRGRLDLTGGDLFLHDGNVRWRRRAVSDGNPRSPAQSPSCRDCAFLPVVRYRCLCRDRCRLSVTSSALRYPQEGVTSATPASLISLRKREDEHHVDGSCCCRHYRGCDGHSCRHSCSVLYLSPDHIIRRPCKRKDGSSDRRGQGGAAQGYERKARQALGKARGAGEG